MDINQLRTFAAVAREGNLTRATELLFLSQPAISAHIKSLEDELGVKLFFRTPRGVKLTTEGGRLLNDAEKVLSAHAEMLSHAKGLTAAISGKVRLGTVANPEMLKLDALMKRMSTDYPSIQVQMLHGQSGDVISGVKAGKLDCGYIIGNKTEDGLASVKLKQLNIRIVAPAAWKDRIESATWQEMLSLPWVWRTAPSFCHQVEEQIFRENNVKPNVAVEVDNPLSTERLVAAGVGLALMHEEEAEKAQEAGAVVLWGEAELGGGLYFVYPSERKTDPLIASIVSVIKEIWAPSSMALT